MENTIQNIPYYGCLSAHYAEVPNHSRGIGALTKAPNKHHKCTVA
jgi:hypothetical protein